MGIDTLMAEFASRWSLPDLQSTVNWCKARNSQGVRCILDALGEYARDKNQSLQSVTAYTLCARAIHDNALNASISMKLTSIGAIFDKTASSNNLNDVALAARQCRVDFELDMEGRNLVDYTVDTALARTAQGYPTTLAVQAYLNRSVDDLKVVLEHGIRARIVKGAYVGDAHDFEDIQERFKALAMICITNGQPFSVGTHDPQLIEWLLHRTAAVKDTVEFGFLKGLAEATKLDLARQGWKVAEYVPFGSNKQAYEARRLKYLKELDALKRSPAP